jgi:hypothetical protein
MLSAKKKVIWATANAIDSNVASAVIPRFRYQAFDTSRTDTANIT